MGKVNYICEECKSDDISFDACAEWDADNQDFGMKAPMRMKFHIYRKLKQLKFQYVKNANQKISKSGNPHDSSKTRANGSY